jgi:hypothetical protein
MGLEDEYKTFASGGNVILAEGLPALPNSFFRLKERVSPSHSLLVLGE